MVKTIEPVVFLTREQANTTFTVSRKTRQTGRAADGVPIMELAEEDTKAVFRAGICQTDNPDVVSFLDGREDCWRANDRLASLKMQYGSDEVGRIAEAVAAGAAPVTDEESVG